MPSIADLLNSEGETELLPKETAEILDNPSHVPGDITSGVPSLAELLQSDGETDQLMALTAQSEEDNLQNAAEGVAQKAS